MRAIAPSNRPRVAAAQRMDQPPSSAVVGRGGMSTSRSVGAADPTYTARYQEWQDHARKYARTVGIARFSAALTSSTCRRCTLRVEERNATGDWVESEDPRLTAQIFDAYRNDLLNQKAAALIGLHAYHYSVAGECHQVVSDGQFGTNWGIYSTRALEFDKPEKGLVLVKLVPNGTQQGRTAFAVTREQVVRFWLPDEEWQAYATSPMVASIDDLHRLWSLNRLVRRTADSRLIMNGVFWTPGEAHEDDAQEQDQPGSGQGNGQPTSKLDKAFVDWARRAFSDDDDIAAHVPFGMHWDHDYGEPKHVDVGRGLDEQGPAHREEARRDFARGVDMPASMAAAGGPGDSNHWTEWLVDEKFFDGAIAPTMDRICHDDLTVTFLAPVVHALNLQPERYRVGYDPSAVIVKPDQSEMAITLYKIGLLKGDKTLEACNFDPDDRMSVNELQALIQLAQAGGYGSEALPFGVQKGLGGVSTSDNGLPAGPANVTPGPPERPTGPPEPPALTAAAGEPVDTPDVDPAVASRVLAKITQYRRDLGRALAASAEVAFRSAMKAAGRKVATRVRGRKAGTAASQAAALAAVDSGAALGPHLAAVGITEAEALHQAFDTYTEDARRRMAAHRDRERQLLEQSGIDPDRLMPNTDEDEHGAAYLAAALLALAYRRLTDGPSQAPAAGELVAGDVPASIIVRAVDIAEGRARASIAEAPDQLPTVASVVGRSLERDVVDELLGPEAPIEYTWEWGFFNDPVRPFEPHEDLAGFTTTMPGADLSEEVDPALALTDAGDWVESDYYQPQDHPGCSCTWLPTAGRESGPGTRPVELPNPGTTALEAAGVLPRAAAGRTAAYNPDQERAPDGKFGSGGGGSGKDDAGSAGEHGSWSAGGAPAKPGEVAKVLSDSGLKLAGGPKAQQYTHNGQPVVQSTTPSGFKVERTGGDTRVSYQMNSQPGSTQAERDAAKGEIASQLSSAQSALHGAGFETRDSIPGNPRLGFDVQKAPA